MDEKLSINVKVVDRQYPLKIDRKDEEVIRKAAALINEKVALYKQRYTEKDTQDFLAMAALQFVIKNVELELKSDDTDLMDQLSELNDELVAVLKKE